MNTPSVSLEDFKYYSQIQNRTTQAGSRAWNRLTLHGELFAASSDELMLPEDELWLPDLVVSDGLLSANGLISALRSGRLEALYGISDACCSVVRAATSEAIADAGISANMTS